MSVTPDLTVLREQIKENAASLFPQLVENYQRKHQQSTNKNGAFSIFIRRIEGYKYQAILTCEVPRRTHCNINITENKTDILAMGAPVLGRWVELALWNLLDATSDLIPHYIEYTSEDTKAALAAGGKYVNSGVLNVN